MENKENIETNNCPNCGQTSGEGKFCPSCGQKTNLPKLTLRSIFGDFFSIIFNLDNQFFNTIRGGLVPGKLATSYVQGHRKKYLHPLRFFFYAWLAYAMISSLGERFIDTDFNDKNQKSHIRAIIENKPIDIKEADTTTFKGGFLQGLKYKSADSTEQTTEEKKSFNLYPRKNITIQIVVDSTGMKVPSEKSKTILLSDLQELALDSLYQKYAITHWRDKFALSRTKRFDTAGINAIYDYFTNHIIWLVFGVIPFSALWLKILFWRSKKLYAEHVLYLLYLFAAFFVLLILFHLALQLPDPLSDIVSFPIAIAIVAYSFLSLKNYYQRKPIKTFFKWLLYLLGNSFLFLMVASFYIAISLILF